MALPQITLEGRAVADPDLKFTASGKAVCSLRVAASESKKTDAGWEDGDKLFVNASIWEASGEAVAEHIRKGDKITVTGRLFMREYEKTDGTKGQSLEVKFATVAKVIDAPRSNRQPAAVGAPVGVSGAAAVDPWAVPAATDEPPF